MPQILNAIDNITLSTAFDSITYNISVRQDIRRIYRLHVFVPLTEEKRKNNHTHIAQTKQCVRALTKKSRGSLRHNERDGKMTEREKHTQKHDELIQYSNIIYYIYLCVLSLDWSI